MKKRMLSAILLLLPLIVNAYDVEIDGIYYNLDSKTGVAEVTYKTTDFNSYSGSVTIPEKFTYGEVDYAVNSIGEKAFFGSSGLTSVNIPNSVMNIGENAFSGCKNLTSISINSNSIISRQYTWESNIGTIFGSQVLSYTIGDDVTSIGDYAFKNCSSILSLSIGNSVTSIGHWAFSSCSGLSSLIIPNSVTSIGGFSFSECSGMTSINIPDSIKNIGESTFDGCTSLLSIIIPNSVSSIGDMAFRGCIRLNSISIPNSVNEIGKQAFRFCRGLTSFIIPNSVTSINELCFDGCSSISELTLPDNLKIIKAEAFQGCSSLYAVTIPSSVEYIYSKAFANCTNLKSVTAEPMTPPYLHDNAFSNYNIPLYVPKESYGDYKTAQGWKNFTGINPISGEIQKCATPSIYYADKKLTFSCETEDVTYSYTITDADVKTGKNSEVSLTATYIIEVYAEKEGYQKSDVATATLVWTEATFTETTPPAPTSAKAISQTIPLLISANDGTITVNSPEGEGQTVNVYSIDGKSLGSGTIRNGKAIIQTSLTNGDPFVVKAGNRSVKLMMK